ncbi:hypothetical protein Sa4125_26110 [Aureimonas sp. SA4125]|uniref:hypothetical protein n=1 Tax=Aureimonas sp. SA4125 TaxID=2826993 RepID=UPI001CC5A2CB|nr:hypothetical protein [Aureimonas sp. SA4125]BDA85069.1 hypothetical protein Sa4125_26110 [Aureimonas sp. SA4125]
MADTEIPSPANNHTLAYPRRLEQRHEQLLQILIRQQELVGRLDRNMSEGFASLERELRDGLFRTDRDLREVKTDLVLAENNILNRIGEHSETSIRINDHEDRICSLEAERAGPAP